MSLLLAVDPGSRATGLAVFVEGVLITCTTLRLSTREIARTARAERCGIMSEVVQHWIDENLDERGELAIEWPQIYRGTRSKGDPNDLLLVAGVAAAIASQWWLAVHSYTPAEWAGQLSKTAKASRVRSRLDGNESVLVDGVGQDAIDAVGIGLHHLGRLGRRRAFALP